MSPRRQGGRPAAPPAALPIRLVALDIDGTLVGEDLVVHDRTRAAIAGAIRHGATVTLVTGRMATSAIRFARELDLGGAIIAYQGGLARCIPEPGSTRVGRLLWHRPVPAAVAREAIAWSRERGLDPHVNHLERFILRADDPRADDYSVFMGSRAELVPDLLAAIDHPVTKVIAVGDEHRPLDVLADARAHFAGRADVTISHPRFLEFVAPGVSKGNAVRRLARRLDVPLSQVLAIGDQHNDLEMIAAVGHGVAMPSAPAVVREAARYVAPPLAEEGAAAMIEALVLAAPATAAANAHRLAGPDAGAVAAGR
jgi:Cof subfamily protein (haloacid dehalogenase superfamily)